MRAGSALGFTLFATAVAATDLTNYIEDAVSYFEGISTSVTNGDYVFTNVANGKVLSFIREDSLTNVYPMSSGYDALEVQYSDGLVRLSGGNNKCISAQWNVGSSPGYDHAAVSYACVVGSGTSGSTTLEKTKQWWYLVEAGTVSSSTLLQLTGSSEYTASVGDISFSSKTSSASASSTSTSSSASSTAAAKSVSLAATSSNTTKTCSKTGAWLSRHPAYVVSYNHPECLATLVDYVGHSCTKSGAWLSRHSAYITKYNHPECEPVLESYKASLRRKRSVPFGRRHIALSDSNSAKLYRLGQEKGIHQNVKKSTTAYYIIARDHVTDMTPRAISNSQMTTYGGYTSTTLDIWDPNDTAQMWYMTSS